MKNQFFEDQQLCSFESHPIVKDTAILPTRPLEDFVNVINEWLDYLLPGGVIYGLQRIGKTYAIDYFRHNCYELIGYNIPSAFITMWEPAPSSNTESRFFKELLHEMEYSLYRSGNAGDKRDRAVDFILELTNENKEHRFLLFVDEAQWLCQEQYRYLMDLHNRLKKKEVRLITILVGQPEMRQIKSDFKKDNQRHILGRFMTAMHEFEGVTGKEDFHRILNSLDIGSEYPIGSGCSYTQFFVPQAFNAGWRFSEQSDNIWDILIQVCVEEKIPSFQQLPMQPLSAVIRWLLKTMSKNDSPVFKLEDSLIEDAIINTAVMQISDLTN